MLRLLFLRLSKWCGCGAQCCLHHCCTRWLKLLRHKGNISLHYERNEHKSFS